MKRRRDGWLFSLFLLISIAGWAQAQPSSKQEIPAVNADIGACSAEFLVRDASGKPLYDAKVSLIVHSGFLGLRKTEVQVGTNSEGRARVTGLPAKSKKPLEFIVRYQHRAKTVTDDPGSNCGAQFDVRLGGEPGREGSRRETR
jgi:hypothetical protein